MPPPARFIPDQQGPPSRFKPDVPEISAPDPNEVRGEAAVDRFVDAAKGTGQLFSSPKSIIEALAGPGLPAYRAITGAFQSGKEGLHQARQYTKDAQQIKDPITRLLTNLRAGTTVLGSVNPLTSSSVTNINRLEDQGQPEKAEGQGAADIAMMLFPGTKSGRETVRKTVDAPGKAIRVAAQEIGGAGREPVVKAARAREEAVANQAARSAEQSKDFVQKSNTVRQAEQAAAATEAQKEVINRARSEYAKRVTANLQETRKAVKGALDQRWGNLREQMGSTPVNSVPIKDAIDQARSQYLVGSPEDLKSFNDLMERMERPGVDPNVAVQPLGWDEARTHFSNISDRLYSGNLPGNVYKALGVVRDALDQQLSAAARTQGLGAEYGALKRDWAQYKGDFDDLSSLKTRGGSPLAQAVRFQSPADMEALLNSKYGENLIQRVSKYSKQGANPKIIDTYRELGRRADALPATKVPARPNLPKRPEPIPQIDPVQIRRQRLEDLAGRPFGIHDINPARALEHMLVKYPQIREWIAKQPRQELRP